jgi:hypothetical protein
MDLNRSWPSAERNPFSFFNGFEPKLAQCPELKLVMAALLEEN